MQATSPRAVSRGLPQDLCGALPTPSQPALALAAPVAPSSSPALAQSAANPSEEQPSEKERPISYGLEIGFGSGHADRGFVISDRPVIQPEAWVSGRGLEFSLWSNFTLATTTDGSRPEILELELTRAQGSGHLTIAPAITMVFYRDALSIDRSRSIEGWLHVSYDAGPLRLFTHQSVYVLTDGGAYYGEAGIESERHVSRRVEVGGSLAAGWASSRFNDAYADIAKSALNRISVEGWLKRYPKPHVYIGPYFEFSTTVDPAVRAALARPTFFIIGLTTGVER